MEAMIVKHGAADFTPTSWQAPAGMPFDEWLRHGNTLQAIERCMPWWLGDYLNYGEAQYGETYAQAIEATGMRAQRLMNYKWVAAAVPDKLDDGTQHRIDPAVVSWTAHRLVACLEVPQQRQWLQQAAAGGWSSAQLAAVVNGAQPIPLPEGPYDFFTATGEALTRAGFPGQCNEQALLQRVQALAHAYLQLVAQVARHG